MLAALSFLKPEEVILGFEDILETWLNESCPVLEYFEDTYIVRPLRHGRRKPRFDIEIWNKYERICLNLPRTNNSVEGWHSGFNRALQNHHMSIINFLTEIIIEHNKTELIFAQLHSGQKGNSHSKAYITISTKIANMIRNYNNNRTAVWLPWWSSTKHILLIKSLDSHKV
jgi:hypothetical protein